VERVVLLSDKEVIMPEDLPDEILQNASNLGCLPDIGDGTFDLEKLLEKIEKDYLVKALAKSRGVKTEAAKILNLSFRSFRHRLHKYGVK
jgi:two-component system response regulator PilR (NtrC family)